jgi:hypothetical protein
MDDISQKSSTSTSTNTSNQMQALLNEFKSLYQNRLKKIEKQDPKNEETIKSKIKTLEAYVKDLLEQNDVLVQTIDELEHEANSRVNLLENRLQKTLESLKVSKTRCACLTSSKNKIKHNSPCSKGSKFKNKRPRS